MTHVYEAGVASTRPTLDRPVLFETKLRDVQPAGKLLPRPRLTDILSGSRGRLILLSAPPGFGKTTLLKQWRDVEDRPVATVSLDPGDNDAALFWSYVVEAMRRVEPRIGDTAVAALRTPCPDLLEAVVPALVQELQAFGEEIVLVLDDLQAIENAALYESLALFVERRPQNVTLALSTRSDPPIPIGRLRTLGGLAELRAVDLCFTEDEQAALLNDTMKLALSAEDVHLLYERTEGWPVGVQLASISLRTVEDPAAFIASFGGSSRHVVDYLTEVVLDTIDSDRGRFLVETSILEWMNGPLCDAVTDRRGSAELLVELERANLFLVPLDDRREHYRYHHLFAEVLLSHLERSDPGIVPELHGRAAEWLAGEGLTLEAVRHALGAGDVETAIRLASEAWLGVVGSGTGQVETFVRLLEGFPNEAVDGDPRLALIRTWALSLLNRRDEAREAGEAAAAAELDGAGLALVHARFPWGDVGGALAAAGEACSPEAEPHGAWHASALLALGWMRYLSGDADGAAGPLRRAAHRGVRTHRWLVAADAKALLARLSLDGGDVDSAETHALDAMKTVADHDLSAQSLSGVAQISLGAVLARNGRPEDAWKLLDEGLTRLRAHGEELYLADALLLAAPVRRALGDPHRARELLAEARGLIESCPDAGLLHTRLEDAARSLTPAHRRVEGDSDLTEREREVLQYLADGLPKREIAHELFLSFNTIHSHTKSIYQKLRVSSRAAAIERGRELGAL